VFGVSPVQHRAGGRLVRKDEGRHDAHLRTSLDVLDPGTPLESHFMKLFLPTAAVLTLSLLLVGCETAGTHDHAMHDHATMAAASTDPHAAAHANMWASVNHAVAVIYPTKGNQVSGTLSFDKTPGGVHIHGTISGLEPRSTHAMHIHEFGDSSSDDGMSAGSHYNPERHEHGDVTNPTRHAGDLGNIKADDSGKATVDLTLADISLADVRNPVIGRGVVIHAKQDDFSQPVGNAGGRLGVGVIGIAKNP
jgi:Cu-Zn family superoxide dismutase